MTNNNKEIILTIFTPSYNRAHLLQRLYESLLTQKSKNFIWLIVDDGSTDDTQELIDSYIKQNKINIEYVYQKNCGKYIAHNVAAFHAETKLFCTVDSDDVVLGNAVDTIISKWKKLNIDCQKRCAGLLMPFDNVNTGDIIVQKRNLIDLYQKKGFRGEAFIIFKTDIVKRFLFPAIRNEKFLSESAYLRCIDQHYYYCCENDRIVTRKYYSDGLTKSINKIENKNRYSRAYAWKIDAAYGGKFLEKINAYGKYKKIRKKLGYEEFPEIEVNFVTRICSLLPFF